MAVTYSGHRMDTHFQDGSFFMGGKYALCFILVKTIQILPEEPPSYIFTLKFSSHEELCGLNGKPAQMILFLKVSVAEEYILLYSLEGSIVTRLPAWQNTFYALCFEAKWGKFSVHQHHYSHTLWTSETISQNY